MTSYEVCCRLRLLICRRGIPLRSVGRQAARALLGIRHSPDRHLEVVTRGTRVVGSHGSENNHTAKVVDWCLGIVSVATLSGYGSGSISLQKPGKRLQAV